jgi:ribosome-associated toxin RatA of RatAB toxin-antitoxin module
MAEINQSIEIEASPKACYEVITDFESYPDFLSETQEVEILSQKKEVWEIRFTVKIIKKLSYVLKLTGKPFARVAWQLVEPSGLIKNNVGHWDLKEIKKNRTLATYTIDIEIAGPIPASVSKSLIGSSLPAMMKAFKDRIESQT